MALRHVLRIRHIFQRSYARPATKASVENMWLNGNIRLPPIRNSLLQASALTRSHPSSRGVTALRPCCGRTTRFWPAGLPSCHTWHLPAGASVSQSHVRNRTMTKGLANVHTINHQKVLNTVASRAAVVTVMRQA